VEKLEPERQRLADLVFLQVPDEVPPGSGRQDRDFRPGFLDPAFAKDGLSGVEHLLDGFRGLRFGDGDKPDLLGIAPGTRGGIGNGGPDGG
jgi:hypothetical protein